MVLVSQKHIDAWERRDWTLAEHLEFHSMPEPNSGCQLWLGSVNHKGYGQIYFKVEGRFIKTAHRAAWWVAFGPIPKGKCVLHKCDVPSCINPTHLFVGTNAVNNRDKAIKKRAMIGERCHFQRLKQETIRAIFWAPGTKQSIAERFGVSPTHVRHIKRRETWWHLDMGNGVGPAAGSAKWKPLGHG